MAGDSEGVLLRLAVMGKMEPGERPVVVYLDSIDERLL
jgi:hypothetical protein